jgi:molecular chaperone GrpE
VTEHERDAGSGNSPGPAREQIVIKDNRKIDSSGRPKDQGDKAEPAKAQPDPTPPTGGVGRPGTPEAATEASAEAAGPATVEPEPATAPAAAPAGKHEKPEPAGEPRPGVPPALGAELESLRSELDERLKDLQRVSAEYANYRKRVERDRGVVVEQAIGAVLTSLLPILDDVDRARDHGDLNGPFAAVAEQLTTALAKFGLNVFGEKGDPFDPTRHEAVTHETSPDVTEPTCVSVMRRGYLLGDRLLRPAMVAVADPE